MFDVNILFDENFPRPLFIPPEWESDLSGIESLERVFWRISEKNTANFGKFIDALASEAEVGTEILKEIAGSRRCFIVVQLSDAYKLSLTRPNSVGVGFRDFPAGGDIHEEIIQVKNWLDKQDLRDYAVESGGLTKKRAYYLENIETAKTLLVQMLPFGNFDPLKLSSLKLVANYGSYWVYELVSEDGDLRSKEKDGVSDKG